MVRTMLLAVSAVALTGNAQANGGIVCRNEAVQVNCGGGSCEATTDAFTPFSVSRSGDTLQVCAYSGCWSGEIEAAVVRGDFRVDFADLSREFPEDIADQPDEASEPVEASLFYDTANRVGFVYFMGFANPLTCESFDMVESDN
uniref:hypothetical protein n=1 Tax=Parerythrobacter lutipelagi TaxID=1964208 RepID=UPI0010F56753|nr:hypothetical protein [Parerythrobacter lutipelagi]